MILIDAEFPTRREADAFAAEIEAAYPPERGWGTVLHMQRVTRVQDGTETDWHRVYGERREAAI